MNAWALSTLWIAGATLPAQQSLGDLHSGPPRVVSAGLVPHGVIHGRACFHESTLTQGLWSTDGTAGGLRPMWAGGNVGFACELGSAFAFVVHDGGTSSLCLSNGTLAGARVAVGLPSGFGSSGVLQWQGRIFGADERQLWVTDGTLANTRNLPVAASWIRPGSLTAVGSWVAFGADSTLWRTDGSEAGTHPIASFDQLGRWTYQVPLAAIGQRAFFVARNKSLTDGLWVSDGTPTGTTLVADLLAEGANHRVDMLLGVGTRLFFRSWGDSGQAFLWVSDGTGAGTRILARVSLECATGHQGLLYFAGRIDQRTTLWRSDGTVAGTWPVHAIEPGGSREIHSLRSDGTRIWFFARDSQHGLELWSSDGATAGTRLVADIAPGPADGIQTNHAGWPILFGGEALLEADDGRHGRDLWRSDGSAAGTRLLHEIDRSRSAGSYPEDWVEVGGRAYFVATTVEHGRELWVSDGTPDGTRLFLDLVPGTDSSRPGRLRGSRDGFYFALEDNNQAPLSLWFSDGSAAGTRQLVAGGIGWDLAVRDDRAFFARRDASGSEPWTSDGTVQGTQRLQDIAAGPGSSDPYGFTATPSCMFFVTGRLGAFPQFRAQIWRSDGTPAGTRFVADLDSGANVPFTTGLAVLGTRVLFAHLNLVESWLGCSDGTAAGTLQLARGTFSAVFAAGAQAFAFEERGPGATWLWVTDGTPAGTRIVRSLPAQPAGRLRTAAGFAGKLLFAQDEPGIGIEPWISDGTAAGTRLLKDCFPGPQNGTTWDMELAAIDGTDQVFFTARDQATGHELWRTDGTEGGTVRMTDLNPGLASARPAGFLRRGRFLLFRAEDGVSGEEPWCIDFAAAHVPLAAGFGQACGAKLQAVGLPRLGNLGFWLVVAEGPRNAALCWLLSGSRQELRLFDCVLHVGLPAYLIGGTSDPNGRAALPLPVPPAASLLGRELFCQCALAGAPLALSDAMHVLVGR